MLLTYNDTYYVIKSDNFQINFKHEQRQIYIYIYEKYIQSSYLFTTYFTIIFKLIMSQANEKKSSGVDEPSSVDEPPVVDKPRVDEPPPVDGPPRKRPRPQV